MSEEKNLNNDVIKASRLDGLLGGDYDVSPNGGERLTKEQAAIALREAMRIIQLVGTTGINHKTVEATAWMRKYFPNHEM